MYRIQKAGAALAAGVALIATAAGAATLVKDGHVRCAIVLTDELRTKTVGPYATTPKDGTYTDIAVREIEEHLGLVAQGTVPVTNVPATDVGRYCRGLADDGRTAVVLGGPELDAALAGEIRRHGGEAQPDPESFALQADNRAVTILGLSPKGVLNGVYELLEQVGFRWYMPGDTGRVVPDTGSLDLKNQRSLEVPSFRGRQVLGSGMSPFPTWTRRMRNSVWAVRARHGIPPLESSGKRRKWFAEHPEHFALINGERVPRQLCVSNPDVLRLAIDAALATLRDDPGAEFYAMGPNDGSGFCECENCRALDGGEVTPFTDRPSVTDRYIWFYNRVLEGIEDEFPNVKIGTLIYSDTMMPPVKIDPDPRITGKVALIHLCRIHSPRNPVCPEAGAYLNICDQWQARGAELYDAGYWFNLADPGMPFIMVHRVRDEIPLSYELGHLGMSRAPAAQWANEGPSLYLAHKLMWNHTADVDALLDEYFRTFYGPAAEPMHRYIMGLDTALHNADYHTGRSWDLLFIYDADVRSMARQSLAEAQRLAGEGVYGVRVRIAAEGWEYFEAFADMIESRRRHEYVQSMQALERARDLVERLTTAYDTPMLRVSTRAVSAAGFLQRLFAGVTEEGYARVTEGNTFVAGLDATWDFLLDPQQVGETIALYRNDIQGGNWRAMDTSSSWGNQGLRYYFGEAWYRQEVNLPKTIDGRKLMLWFAGVDDAAKVWLNGTLLGVSPGAVFDIDAHSGTTRPFELDATEAAIPGGVNVVTVRVRRNNVNELGTGGIMGPVMFYATAESR